MKRHKIIKYLHLGATKELEERFKRIKLNSDIDSIEKELDKLYEKSRKYRKAKEQIESADTELENGKEKIMEAKAEFEVAYQGSSSPKKTECINGMDNIENQIMSSQEKLRRIKAEIIVKLEEIGIETDSKEKKLESLRSQLAAL